MSFEPESDLGQTLRREPRRTGGRWVPVLVAAAVVLVIAGAVAVTTITRDGRRPTPAPPEPSPTQVATTTPIVPYVLDERLFVGGERVAGEWSQVWSGAAAWIALGADYETWSWGTGSVPGQIEGAGGNDIPAISPGGEYVAYVDSSDSVVTGFETATGGEGFGAEPIKVSDPADGDPVGVKAMTDDGLVIVQGLRTSLLWRPLVDGETVDLGETAPGVRILRATPAGLVVTDGDEESPFLAELSEDGAVRRLADLPAHDDLATSPDGEWMAWSPLGTTGGEVRALGALQVGTVDGSQRSRLDAPSGWGFAVRSWVWEDDDHLVALLLRENGESGQRLARCAVDAGRCVLVAH